MYNIAKIFANITIIMCYKTFEIAKFTTQIPSNYLIAHLNFNNFGLILFNQIIVLY